MIKLNDEEIMNLIPGYFDTAQRMLGANPQNDKAVNVLPSLQYKAIAKAQLKKVVEYLDTLEFYDDWGGKSGKMLRDSIKQALLEEVK